MTSNPRNLHLVLLTGMSGSGKSVALNVLEDIGYYCVDNLPPELLTPLLALERTEQTHRLAIAMDVRSASSLPLVPQLLLSLKASGIQVSSIFLDATTDTLIRRFSETRRRHPLSQAVQQHSRLDQRHALAEAIDDRQTAAQPAQVAGNGVEHGGNDDAFGFEDPADAQDDLIQLQHQRVPRLAHGNLAREFDFGIDGVRWFTN